MSQLDVAKEQISYLKFWLGILAVTDIGLIGWLVSNFFVGSPSRVFACWLSVFSLSAVLAALHRKIDTRIGLLRHL
jgi:hypothetical protein